MMINAVIYHHVINAVNAINAPFMCDPTSLETHLMLRCLALPFHLSIYLYIPMNAINWPC